VFVLVGFVAAAVPVCVFMVAAAAVLAAVAVILLCPMTCQLYRFLLFSLALFDQWRQCVSLWWRVSEVLSNLITLCIRYSSDHIIYGLACVNHCGGCGNICLSF
jgi:hypothetical protein